MIKNRTAKLVFQTTYLVLGLIGILGSLGYFYGRFSNEFYIKYTSISNYICVGVMIACFIQTIKASNKNQDEYVSTCPKFYFMCNIMILVTFLVYNILLAKENSVSEYFLSISNLTNHLILPIMFVLHWVLFYEHGKTKWYYPLLSLILPLVYVAFILIRAAILGSNYSGTLYPYFFLNVAKLGIGKFIIWILALVLIFTILGYIIFALDNLKRRNYKKR